MFSDILFFEYSIVDNQFMMQHRKLKKKMSKALHMSIECTDQMETITSTLSIDQNLSLFIYSGNGGGPPEQQ